MVTTLSKSEESNMTVSLYWDTVSPIGLFIGMAVQIIKSWDFQGLDLKIQSH